MTNLYSQQNNQRGKLFQDVNHYELLNDVYFYVGLHCLFNYLQRVEYSLLQKVQTTRVHKDTLRPLDGTCTLKP